MHKAGTRQVSLTCTRLEGSYLHANSFGICNFGKHVHPARCSRKAYGNSSKDGIWLRNRVQALASARCEVMRSCFILHCVAENSGDLRFLARSRQISPRAVLGTIGRARNRLSATGVEIGITWMSDRPQAGRGPVSWACELEDRPALDLGTLWLRLSEPWRMANGRRSGRQLETIRLADCCVLRDPQDLSNV